MLNCGTTTERCTRLCKAAGMSLQRVQGEPVSKGSEWVDNVRTVCNELIDARPDTGRSSGSAYRISLLICLPNRQFLSTWRSTCRLSFRPPVDPPAYPLEDPPEDSRVERAHCAMQASASKTGRAISSNALIMMIFRVDSSNCFLKCYERLLAGILDKLLLHFAFPNEKRRAFKLSNFILRDLRESNEFASYLNHF